MNWWRQHHCVDSYLPRRINQSESKKLLICGKTKNVADPVEPVLVQVCQVAQPEAPGLQVEAEPHGGHDGRGVPEEKRVTEGAPTPQPEWWLEIWAATRRQGQQTSTQCGLEKGRWGVNPSFVFRTPQKYPLMPRGHHYYESATLDKAPNSSQLELGVQLGWSWV